MGSFYRREFDRDGFILKHVKKKKKKNRNHDFLFIQYGFRFFELTR